MTTLTIDSLQKPFAQLAIEAGFLSAEQQQQLLEYQSRFLALTELGVSVNDPLFTSRQDKNLLEIVAQDWPQIEKDLQMRGLDVPSKLNEVRTRVQAAGGVRSDEAPGIGELAVGYKMLADDIEHGVKVKQSLLAVQAATRSISALDLAKEAVEDKTAPTPEQVAQDIKFSRIGVNPSDSKLLVTAQSNWRDAEVFLSRAKHAPNLLMSEDARLQYTQMRGTAIANVEAAMFTLKEAGHDAAAQNLRDVFMDSVFEGKWQRMSAPSQSQAPAQNFSHGVNKLIQGEQTQKLLEQNAGPSGIHTTPNR